MWSCKYGLAKVHKAGCPLRPIMSAIGTPSFALAKFLVPLLAPITTNEFTVKDSFTFAKELCGMQNDGFFMASFDVKSLFTNIPLNETIDICVEDLFAQAPPQKFFRKNIRSMLSNCVLDYFFFFDSKYYEQIDGVAMGSPLGPTLANGFLCHYEKKTLVT